MSCLPDTCCFNWYSTQEKEQQDYYKKKTKGNDAKNTSSKYEDDISQMKPVLCTLFDEIIDDDQNNTTFDEFLNEFNLKLLSRWGIKVQTEQSICKMDKPLDSSYKKHTKSINDFYIIRLGKDIDPCTQTRTNNTLNYPAHIINTSIPYPTQYRPISVEERGITIRQLLSVMQNVNRRCIKEKWKRQVYKDGKLTDEYIQLIPKTVNMHDINQYIIKPFTRLTGKSFVESLPSTAGSQPPRWFISHTWSESFSHTMDCLMTHVKDFECNLNNSHEARGGGMILDTPVWICAYANNQHELYADIPDDPSQTGFVKAMNRAGFRTISILDEKGDVFSRIWCVLELFFTLFSNANSAHTPPGNMDTKALWAIYTPFDHITSVFEGPKHAVGIVNGGTTNDRGDAFITARREKKFPVDRILNSLKIDVENAKASVGADKKHILNHIAGRSQEELDETTIKNDPNYKVLNDEVKGAFAASSPALLGALLKGHDQWRMMLMALKNGSNVKKLRFDFRHFWDDLKAESAVEMIQNLPSSIEELGIFSAPYGAAFMDALILWIGTTSNLKNLRIFISCAGGSNTGRDFGIKFAEALGKSKIEEFQLDRTDLIGSRNFEYWLKAFEKNQRLKKLRLSGMLLNIAFVNESTFDEKSSTVQHHFDDRQRIHYKQGDKCFPDSSMTKEQVQQIKEITSATDITIDNMY